MNDRHMRDKLSGYIDGMLSQEETSAIKEHLESCPACMEEYEEMVKIIGHMNQMESLETPEFFVEKVHERLEKQFLLQRIIKRIFFPIKIKLPLELAGVAAAALLVIYIVGIREKQHVYELAYAQRSQLPTVLQEQKMERGAVLEEAITVSKKAQPAPELQDEKMEKRDKRAEAEEAISPSKKELPASAPQEKRMERQEPDLAHQKEKIDRKTQIEAEALSITNAQRSEDRSLEIADKEKGEAEKDAPRMATPREENLQDIIIALGGKIIESEYNKDTQVLESLIIEIPVDNYPKLIKTLEERGEIQKPYPAIKEQDQEIIQIRIRLQQ
ncbi:MAG: zf-HC2 domain-containing protein [Candidatus Aminicenantes bacterium]|nr:zf-HC2 domain-containing protein [Candidatus Aminicenantes bacterium]